jgi:hypothetical protein
MGKCEGKLFEKKFPLALPFKKLLKFLLFNLLA